MRAEGPEAPRAAYRLGQQEGVCAGPPPARGRSARRQGGGALDAGLPVRPGARLPVNADIRIFVAWSEFTSLSLSLVSFAVFNSLFNFCSYV